MRVTHASIYEKPNDIAVKAMVRCSIHISSDNWPKRQRTTGHDDIAGKEIAGIHTGGHNLEMLSIQNTIPLYPATTPGHAPAVMPNLMPPAHNAPYTAMAPNNGYGYIPATSPAPQALPIINMPTPTYPRIKAWLLYCDSNPNRQRFGGLTYISFEPKFTQFGIIHLQQLNNKYCSYVDIKDWLGCKSGTALDIIRYANEDLDEIAAGRLHIPS